MTQIILSGARVFDGQRMHDNHSVVVADGRVKEIIADEPIANQPRIRLDGGILAPGLIDLQVNGGDGLMVSGATDVNALRRICAVHERSGATGVLPTLITDTPDSVNKLIAAGIAATRAKVPGFLGLHLEGPYLDVRRKGAHRADLIRRMEQADLEVLCQAARKLSKLMLTVAPTAVNPEQIATLVKAGAVVSLGHTDCTYAEAQLAIAAGATCATHLFNAMSQLGNREAGMVGAVLDGDGYAGLIADAVHVAPEVMRIALRAKPEKMFLVSDCMAFAGSNLTHIELNGRSIFRRDGRLTLEDGTLAGADLTLPLAIKTLVEKVGMATERALSMATSIPAAAVGISATHGWLMSGRCAEMVHLDDDWNVTQVWRAGCPIL